jgi:hypothetical protein
MSDQDNQTKIAELKETQMKLLESRREILSGLYDALYNMRKYGDITEEEKVILDKLIKQIDEGIDLDMRVINEAIKIFGPPDEE